MAEEGEVSLIPPTTAINSSGLLELTNCTVTDPDDGAIVSIGENSVPQFIFGFHGQAVGPFGAVVKAKYTGGLVAGG